MGAEIIEKGIGTDTHCNNDAQWQICYGTAHTTKVAVSFWAFLVFPVTLVTFMLTTRPAILLCR